MSLPASEIAAETQWKKGAELGVDLSLNARWLLNILTLSRYLGLTSEELYLYCRVYSVA